MGSNVGLGLCPACHGPLAANAVSCPACGYRPAPPNTSVFLPAIAVLLGAALVALGCFLPWASATNGIVVISRTGMDVIDGFFILPLAILTALIGLDWFYRPAADLRAALALFGVLAIVAAVIEIVNLQHLFESLNAPLLITSTDMGLYSIGVGGGIVTLAGLLGGGRKG